MKASSVASCSSPYSFLLKYVCYLVLYQRNRNKVLLSPAGNTQFQNHVNHVGICFPDLNLEAAFRHGMIELLHIGSHHIALHAGNIFRVIQPHIDPKLAASGAAEFQFEALTHIVAEHRLFNIIEQDVHQFKVILDLERTLLPLVIDMAVTKSVIFLIVQVTAFGNLKSVLRQNIAIPASQNRRSKANNSVC